MLIPRPPRPRECVFILPESPEKVRDDIIFLAQDIPHLSCYLSGRAASGLAQYCTYRGKVVSEKERTSECKTEDGFLEQHVRLRSKRSHLFLLAGRLSSTSADESLSWRMSFISPPKVSAGTPSLLLPSTLPSLHGDHKLLNIKPCFQSVRRASQCQGPSHPLLHLRRHLGGKISLPLHTPLSLICACIIQAATHTPS